MVKTIQIRSVCFLKKAVSMKCQTIFSGEKYKKNVIHVGLDKKGNQANIFHISP